MYPVLGRIGPVVIGTHDVCLALGVIAACVVFIAEARRRQVRTTGSGSSWPVRSLAAPF